MKQNPEMEREQAEAAKKKGKKKKKIGGEEGQEEQLNEEDAKQCDDFTEGKNERGWG